MIIMAERKEKLFQTSLFTFIPSFAPDTTRVAGVQNDTQTMPAGQTSKLYDAVMLKMYPPTRKHSIL